MSGESGADGPPASLSAGAERAGSRYNVRVLRCDRPAALRAELLALGADPRGVAIMAPKGRAFLCKIEKVTFAAASIVKQEMLAKGGEAALSGEIYFGGERTTDIVLMGSERVYARVVAVLQAQPLPSLQQLAAEVAEALRYLDQGPALVCRVGSRELCWGERTYVMGILNCTPDSFSGDGVLSATGAVSEEDVERAVRQGLSFLEEGADILDVGGESTRPGGGSVDSETELARVLPVIRRLRQETDAPLSIDTYKASVAGPALDAGADMVNDVWGLQMDPSLAPLVAARQVPVVVMHNHSRPKDAEQQDRLGGRYVGSHYDDLLADVVRELRAQVASALQAGIARERVIIDPGIGFGKTVEQNLRLLNHVDELRVLGLPILVGPSRKSFIGYTLDLPLAERLEGTAAAVAVAVMRGADIVRVHDVRPAVRLVRMVDAIMRAE